uniref:BAR domain-containing protein n=1 Tax=Leersia perrieri TaxID=77586 RepID=A0A0D9VGD4_9ORYZ
MKSPLLRLKGFGHHQHHRERKARQPPPAKLDELAEAAQDVEEMRSSYDGFISAGAATTNGVYEFAEALEELGSCLLAKTALNDDDDDSGRVLMMLGKAQYELQKSADRYRTDIIHTITTPSESLLKELQTLEEMKQQCDMKREAYETMRSSYGDKGGSKYSKIEAFSTEQLEASFVEYQEDSALFTFRLKSLKQGQFHSLLTQATRHHAAQLSFFRKGVKCLEALEPRVKAIAEKHHIDYHLSGLEDDGSDNDGYSTYDSCSDDGELSFDYEINDRDHDFLTSRGSMDLDKKDLTTSPKPVIENKQEPAKQPGEEIVFPQLKPNFAHSAPLFPGNLSDQTDRLRQMRPSSTRLAYRLPTPVGDDNPKPSGSHRPHHSAQFFETKPRAPTNLWHSSPLTKDHTAATKPPSSGTDDLKKFKRESWSGPIPIKAGSGKPFSQADHRSSSTMAYPGAMPARPHIRYASSSAVSPKISPKMSPLPTNSLKISELHLLPLPPANVDPVRPSGLVGYSGPLVSKRQAPPAPPARISPTASRTASPLPRPPAALARSYSIPSNSQRTPIITVNKLLESRNSREGSDASSPPLTPLSLSDLSHQPAAKGTAGSTRRKETL